MPTRIGALAAALALTLLPAATLAATTSPANAAAPVVRGETVTIKYGTREAVSVLANDTIERKARARVAVVTTPAALRAYVNLNKQVVVTVPAATAQGTYQIKYRVTDYKDRRAAAYLTVKVPARPSTTTAPTTAPAASTSPTAPVAADATPSCPTTVATRTGAQTAAITGSNASGSWNLTGATWLNNSPNQIVFPIQSSSWGQGCILGGTIDGSIPRNYVREQWYNGQAYNGYAATSAYDDGEGVRVTMGTSPDHFLVVRDAYVSDTEDGFDPNGANLDNATYLDHVHAEWIRDDCIENEQTVVNGTNRAMDIYLHDSLLDGCFAAFAMKPDSSSADAGTSASEFVVADSLVYVQPQPLGSSYCSPTKVTQGRCLPTADSDTWLGAYGLFKWGASAPGKVVVRNTIFRMDVASYSSCTGNRFPTNAVFENVTLVWTGAGPWSKAGGCTNVVPPGVTVTTDVSVWNNAKAAWLARG